MSDIALPSAGIADRPGISALASSRVVDVLFALVAFISASLLFVIQPVAAKRLLPELGGSPAVWTACALFFQTCLLLGYGWTHFGQQWLGKRRFVLCHFTLLIACIILLTKSTASITAPLDGPPVLRVLIALGISIGLPMIALSATSPLLQSWHARLKQGSTNRVYRLYAIGNIASLIVLATYPLFIEPWMTLVSQLASWATLFAMLAGGLAICGGLNLQFGSLDQKIVTQSHHRISWRTTTAWLLLAGVPSSHLLGATTYLTTDVAAVPFLWVIPLAVYLAAFSIAFTGRVLPGVFANAILPALVLLVLVMSATGLTLPVLLSFIVHLTILFLLNWACLARLYRSRPNESGLTSFYLWIAVGGVLGGAINSLIAPVIFDSSLEYPIVLLIGLALLPNRKRLKRVARRIGVVLIALVATIIVRRFTSTGPELFMVAASVAILAIFSMRRNSRLFALAAGLMFLLLTLFAAPQHAAIYSQRSFFGVNRVFVAEDGKTFELFHGSTLHGRQTRDASINAPKQFADPLDYYHRDGPLGEVMSVIHQSGEQKTIGVIGLGVGNIAAYADANLAMRFYEIDPAVIRIATQTPYFSFVRDAQQRGATIDIIEGDGRLLLSNESQRFSSIILDAFSGDSVPVHLLTREAFDLYAARCERDGFIMLHVSNRFLNLPPVVAAAAKSAGLQAFVRRDIDSSTPEKSPSIWMVATHNPDASKLLGPDWKTVDDAADAWTDDFSNLFQTLKN